MDVTMDVQRVAVIGAGAAGLCCARHFGSDPKRFQVEVFEKEGVVGGTWVYSKALGSNPVHSSVYKNLRTNRPKEIMRFPDFPFPSHLPSFVGHQDVCQYLQAYAKDFNIIQYIKFNMIVEEVMPVPIERNESDIRREEALMTATDSTRTVFEDTVKWRITVKNAESGERTSKDYDRVLVCNGHFFEPYIPDIPGLPGFTGKTIHSHRYREPEDFADQHVMVVGAGPSGTDIILDLSSFCKHIYISHSNHLISALPKNISQVPRISRVIEGKRVELVTGIEVEVDSIIFATGYNYSFSFLSKECGITVEDSNRVKPLYKHTFNSLHPSNAFVGLHLGLNSFPMFDYQVQWIKSVWSSTKFLPSTDAMIIDEEANYQDKLKQGISLRKVGHYLGTAQWDLLACYAELSGCDPIAPFYQKVYEAVSQGRRERLMWYKDTNYRILDERTWEIVSTNCT